MKASAAIVLALVCVVGCKGETKYKDSNETLAKLDNCNKQLTAKDDLIKSYADKQAELEATLKNSEIVVTIEGDALTVRPGHNGNGNGGDHVDDETAKALSADFLDQVQKSRGAIQKCYEQALKKNTGLQARTISLTVSASFQPSGAYSRSSFQPALGDAFDGCMKSVAGRWKLPAASQGMTFQATVSLSPS
jgi:hypothetical protein